MMHNNEQILPNFIEETATSTYTETTVPTTDKCF